MDRSIVFHAHFEEVDEGWVQARIEELPAVITVGRDDREAHEFLIDALGEYLLSLAEPADTASSSSGRRADIEIVLGS